MNDAPSLPDAPFWRLLLADAGDASAVCVAFSGGADSSALLHRLAGLRAQIPALRVRALHVDHGLHRDSPGWAQHCRSVGDVLGLAVDVLVVDATPAPGASPEAVAREARYQALENALENGELLLTAHHADDQAETLLLQLLRGAGPAGLAAMPRLTPFGRGWLARPLLQTPAATLVEYCRLHDLHWLDDPSNLDQAHDRNYLRGAVMPLLTSRWPGALRTMSRVASHQAHAAQLLAELAEHDLGSTQTTADKTLPLSLLRSLSWARRSNALRGWLQRCGAPTPSSTQLEQMLGTMLEARNDAAPEVAWAGVLLRRHAQHLYLGVREPAAGPSQVTWSDLGKPLRLGHGRIVATPATGAGVRVASLAGGNVEVRLRRGGERIRPHGDPHTRQVKKLLHATGLPPWQRARMPLLYVGGELLAVPGVCIAASHAATATEPGIRFDWCPAAVERATDHD